MIHLQEINFYSNGEINIFSHICVDSGKIYSEISFKDPKHGDLQNTYQFLSNHQSIDEAFLSILSVVQKYLEQKNLKIVRINNPCKTEFFSVKQQQ